MENSIENDKGFSGIKNLGNTCFLNSCIQVLSHTYELNKLLTDMPPPPPPPTLDGEQVSPNEENTPDTDSCLLTKEYSDLIRLMWVQNGILTPNRFIYVVQHVAQNKNKEMFTGFAQNDATEFLQFLVDCLENACDHKITALFYGKLASTICSVGGDTAAPTIVSKQTEPFFILNVPIPPSPNPTINECIAKFTDCEVLDGDNKWYNETTKQYEDVIKKYDFEELPPILVIVIKRFHHINKNEVLVSFGEFLEFSSGGGATTTKYDLYGVCNHFGNAFFGHYTAFVKHNSGQWIHFNDHIVEKVPEFSNIVSPHAYCLFYRRRAEENLS